MRIIKPYCEPLVPPWKSIEITDTEMDAIIEAYNKYERIECSCINHGLSNSVLTFSQYLKELLQLKAVK